MRQAVVHQMPHGDVSLRRQFRQHVKTDTTKQRWRLARRAGYALATGTAAGVGLKYGGMRALKFLRSARGASMDVMNKAAEPVLTGWAIGKKKGAMKWLQRLNSLRHPLRTAPGSDKSIKNAIRFVRTVDDARRKLALGAIGYSASGAAEQAARFASSHPLQVGGAVGATHLVGGTIADVRRTRRSQGRFARGMLLL